MFPQNPISLQPLKAEGASDNMNYGTVTQENHAVFDDDEILVKFCVRLRTRTVRIICLKYPRRTAPSGFPPSQWVVWNPSQEVPVVLAALSRKQ